MYVPPGTLQNSKRTCGKYDDQRRHRVNHMAGIELGFEKVYQGTTFVNKFNLALSDVPTTITFELKTGSDKEIH